MDDVQEWFDVQDDLKRRVKLVALADEAMLLDLDPIPLVARGKELFRSLYEASLLGRKLPHLDTIVITESDAIEATFRAAISKSQRT